MADETKKESLFPFFAVTWALMLLWAGRGSCSPGSLPQSSSGDTVPGWTAIPGPYVEDPDNEGL